MTADLERQIREALHEDALRARLVNPDGPLAPEERGLDQRRPAPSIGRWCGSSPLPRRSPWSWPRGP